MFDFSKKMIVLTFLFSIDLNIISMENKKLENIEKKPHIEHQFSAPELRLEEKKINNGVDSMQLILNSKKMEKRQPLINRQKYSLPNGVYYYNAKTGNVLEIDEVFKNELKDAIKNNSNLNELQDFYNNNK